jgi:hypothetical protein
LPFFIPLQKTKMTALVRHRTRWLDGQNKGSVAIGTERLYGQKFANDPRDVGGAGAVAKETN